MLLSGEFGLETDFFLQKALTASIAVVFMKEKEGKINGWLGHRCTGEASVGGR